MKYVILHKTAASIVVEPYEALIDKGIKLVEAVKGSGFFSGVSKIVVEHNMDHHYGRVFSNDSKTIYISGDRIKSEFASNPTEQVYQIASTLVHEMTHLKDKMQNGEGPSEAAEAQFLNEVKSKIEAEPKFLDKFATPQFKAIIKNAKPEQSGVSNDDGQLIVTTSARIVFRKNNPEWAHVPNKYLNPFIAEAYKEAPVVKVFQDKNGKDKGELRGDNTNRMVGIIRGNTVAIVSVKGTFHIPAPPTKRASRDTALNAERGWLAEHFLDMFSGQFALDQKAQERMHKYLLENGGAKEMAKLNPHALSQLAASFLAENENGVITRDPQHMDEGRGRLTFPATFPS